MSLSWDDSIRQWMPGSGTAVGCSQMPCAELGGDGSRSPPAGPPQVRHGALVPAGLREPSKELKTLAFKQARLQLVRCHCSKRLSSPALPVAIIKRDDLELYSSDWECFPAPGSACASQPCPGFAVCRAELGVPQPVQN